MFSWDLCRYARNTTYSCVCFLYFIFTKHQKGKRSRHNRSRRDGPNFVSCPKKQRNNTVKVSSCPRLIGEVGGRPPAALVKATAASLTDRVTFSATGPPLDTTSFFATLRAGGLGGSGGGDALGGIAGAPPSSASKDPPATANKGLLLELERRRMPFGRGCWLKAVDLE